jgi:hypothetical protein
LVIDPYWEKVVYYGRYDTGNTVDLTAINSPSVSGSLTNNTSNTKYGAASLQKGSGANWLNLAGSGNTTFPMGTGDFTVEMWVYLSNAPTTNNYGCFTFNQNQNQSPAVNTGGTDGLIFTGVTSPTNGYKMFWYDGGPNPVVIYYAGTNTSNNAAGSPLITPSVWHHIGYCRVGTNLYSFIDGTVFLCSSSYSKNLSSTGGSGATNGGGTKLGTDGYNEYNYGIIFDEVRITKGVGRYTSNFVVPEKAFPTPTLP